MSKEKETNLEEIRKEIAIERLRQVPPNVKVSFGINKGEFMNRDDMITQIETNTDLGKRIIKVQLEYLKAFKNIASIEV